MTHLPRGGPPRDPPRGPPLRGVPGGPLWGAQVPIFLGVLNPPVGGLAKPDPNRLHGYPSVGLYTSRFTCGARCAALLVPHKMLRLREGDRRTAVPIHRRSYRLTGEFHCPTLRVRRATMLRGIVSCRSATELVTQAHVVASARLISAVAVKMPVVSGGTSAAHRPIGWRGPSPPHHRYGSLVRSPGTGSSRARPPPVGPSSNRLECPGSTTGHAPPRGGSFRQSPRASPDTTASWRPTWPP